MNRHIDGKSVGLLKDRSVYPTVSCDLVRHFQGQGRTLKEIGEMMGGLSESFISRVLNKQRSFTLRHLSALEKTLGKPYPIIIIEATRVNSLPKGLRKAYGAFQKILTECANVQISPSS